eukprot:Mrub_06555.p1 GENE.Mrub_06555~~Mrub_06555.p1  ORF type:complete len:313 (+),score=64.74 Mrub_06555:60-941(+)
MLKIVYLYTSWCDYSFVQYIEKNFKITTINVKSNLKKIDTYANKFDVTLFTDYKGNLLFSVGNKVRKFVDETFQLKPYLKYAFNCIFFNTLFSNYACGVSNFFTFLILSIKYELNYDNIVQKFNIIKVGKYKSNKCSQIKVKDEPSYPLDERDPFTLELKTNLDRIVKKFNIKIWLMQSETPLILTFHFFYHTEIMCIDIFNHIVEVLNEYLSDIVPRKRLMTNSEESDSESEYTYVEEKTEDEVTVSGVSESWRGEDESAIKSNLGSVSNLNVDDFDLKSTFKKSGKSSKNN